MRKVSIIFECDGLPFYGVPHPSGQNRKEMDAWWEKRNSKCPAKTVHEVELKLTEKGKLIVDDSDLPPNWSTAVDANKSPTYYDYDDKDRNSRVFCPECRPDWQRR